MTLDGSLSQREEISWPKMGILKWPLTYELRREAQIRQRRSLRTEAWMRHGAHDSHMTFREIRDLAAQHIPGAIIRRRLFWRYSLIWEKEE
jgi:hypothetical protein